jgi:hypothetical protein
VNAEQRKASRYVNRWAAFVIRQTVIPAEPERSGGAEPESRFRFALKVPKLGPGLRRGDG